MSCGRSCQTSLIFWAGLALSCGVNRQCSTKFHCAGVRRCAKRKGPALAGPFFVWPIVTSYLAMRSFDRFVPICVKTVLICPDDVIKKNLSVPLAHCCSIVDV